MPRIKKQLEPLTPKERTELFDDIAISGNAIALYASQKDLLRVIAYTDNLLFQVGKLKRDAAARAVKQ